jgi:pimeloyl-ACP methyl ester carboxylesterase
LLWSVGVLLALLALPPLWFAVLPAPAPELPPPGRRVLLPGGVRVNVVEAGEGPPVLLVHGLPGSAADFRSLSGALVGRGRRAIAYDRVGWGRSDLRPDHRFTVEQNASELGALLEALELQDVTLVGWSYGGLTSLRLAEQAPDRIARLVLIGTGGPDSADARQAEPSLWERLVFSEAVLRWCRWVPPVGARLMAFESDRAFSGGPQPAWWLAGLRANFARWGTVQSFRGEVFQERGGLDPAAIRIPTLLLHGDDDRLAPISVARYLAEAIPEAGLEEFPAASHMLPVTHPEEIAETIVQFSTPPWY